MTTIEFRRKIWTVDDYHRMIEAGVLSESDHVELIEGEIVEMSPIGSPHSACVDRLTQLLVRATGDRAIVRVQGPVQLPPRSEPEPDVALLMPRADFYASGHPGPADTLLVIEVADSSLAFDRTIKLPLYARAGISEAWLVDLTGGAIEVHRDPGPAGYGSVTRHHPGEQVAPGALADVLVEAGGVLGS